MELRDKAGNEKTYNFVETIIFEPDDSETDYVLFADLDENSLLTLGVDSETLGGYGYRYRIICDSTGQEINGNLPAAQRVMARAAGNAEYQVDLSEWPDGKIIVIVQVLDEGGNVTAVRSKTLMKSTEATNISDIFNNETEEFNVYTLSGIQLMMKKENLKSLPKGIYIINGKKVVVK